MILFTDSATFNYSTKACSLTIKPARAIVTALCETQHEVMFSRSFSNAGSVDNIQV